MDNKTLKSCPFCGSSAYFIYKGTVTDQSDDMYDIGCFTLGCYLQYGADWFMSKEEIIKIWNERN